MKYFKFLFLFAFFFLIGCATSDKPDDSTKEKSKFDGFTLTYGVLVDAQLELPQAINEDKLSYSTKSDLLTINGNTIKALKSGTATVAVKCGDEEKELTITIKSRDLMKDFTLSYKTTIYDEVELPAKISDYDVTYSTSSDLITLDGNKVIPIKEGTAKVKAKCLDEEKEITIEVEHLDIVIVESKEFAISLGDDISFYLLDLDKYQWDYDSDAFTKDETKSSDKEIVFTANKIGVFTIKYFIRNQVVEVKVTVEDDSEFFSDDELELYIGEEKEFNVNIIKGKEEDLVLKALSNNIVVDGNKVKGVDIGLGYLEISLNSFKKTIEVNVLDLDIEILSTNLTVDYLETAEFNYKYPEFLGDELVVTISDPSVFTLEGNTIKPLKVGKARIRLSLKEHTDIYKSTMITVAVDPIKIMDMLKQDTVLMRKEVTTYGSTTRTQSVMGSVFRIYFGSLNLTVDYVPLSSDKYVGMKATPELISSLDEKGLIRTGIKLEELKYITYHDTGNNTQGADAMANIRYMIGDYNKSTRARSWHYTVDDGGVYQTIPDDEVSWQGDTYGSYATSIGIETCVNYGIKLDVVWHRMGKLVGNLLYAYGLDIDAVVQHYDWNQKNCPQTLRRNGLYPYAKDMIAAELLFNKTLSSYTVTFKSLSPEYLDDTGQIIKNPTVPIEVTYEINIKNSHGYDETVTYTSTVNPLS